MKIINKGQIIYTPKDKFGYFAWPTVEKLTDGQLVVSCSGFRQKHVDIYGKTCIFLGIENNLTSWSQPLVVNDRYGQDERDPGIIFHQDKVILNWFSSGEDGGHWLRYKRQDKDWSRIFTAPTATPHGLFKHKDQLYLVGESEHHEGKITLTLVTFEEINKEAVPRYQHINILPLPYYDGRWCEPHGVETAHGNMLIAIRHQNLSSKKGYDAEFNTYTIISHDDGESFTLLNRAIKHGSPPHLLTYEGSTLLTYGYRKRPFGVRAKYAGTEYTLESKLSDYDCGYPSTVELTNGTLLTVYYGRYRKKHKTGILWINWEL